MELWIRSQDKKFLAKVNNIICEDKALYYDHHEAKATLGIYKTEERALEILDEIQNILSCKCLLKSYDNLTPEFNNNLIIQPCEVHIEQLNDYVYEMPNE